MTFLTLGLMLAAVASCGDSGSQGGSGTPSVPDDPQPGAPAAQITSDLRADLATDRACYAPGQTVTFTATGYPAGARVRYRHGAEVIADGAAAAPSWTWTAPAEDFTGYMVDLYSRSGDKETIYGTIAVDVSSDWTRFPRYGFVATFDPAKLAGNTIETEMAFLNRCHINGVQFQDWHYKHHHPLGGKPGSLLATYTDIANRTVSTDVVRKYIDVQHGYGMKSIFYNLAFGALDDAASDGVREEWYIFKDRNHAVRDSHDLPPDWKSDIYLVNPGNPDWQAYIADRNDEVYASLDFDGYQIDQLGWRGDRYDYNGAPVDMPAGYASFIDAMKRRHPGKRLIMNAVSNYGAREITGSGKVDFGYTELWDGEGEFKDIYNAIVANDVYSGNKIRSTFAAYMNYGKSNAAGTFNNPGVIMTDAVIFALGGAHLELGDHMLCNEYFPNASLGMNNTLRTAMIRYYDFATAYQNLLRGNSIKEGEAAVDLTCTNRKVKFQRFPGGTGSVNTFAKNVDGRLVVNLLNFSNIDNLSWRDFNGERRVPPVKKDIAVSMNHAGKVSKVWAATPDYHGGVPVELHFEQKGNTLAFTVPNLLYWTMIVVE